MSQTEHHRLGVSRGHDWGLGLESDVQDGPLQEYQRRLEQRQVTWQQWASWDQRLSTARGVTFLVGLVVAVFSGETMAEHLLAALPFAAGFVVLLLVHARVLQRLKQAQAACRHYQRCCQRIEGHWVGVGLNGVRYLDTAHPYAADLDLFGDGSLFQLINQARTRLGEDRLASWLLQPADAETVGRRQQIVDSLRPELDMREAFAVLDAAVHDGIDQGRLSVWVQQPVTTLPSWVRPAAWMLASAAIVALACWMFLGIGHSPLVLVLLIEIPFLFSLRKTIHAVAESVEDVDGGLRVLSRVLQIIEQQRFENPFLVQLQLKLQHEHRQPSAWIGQLDRCVENLNNCLKNQFMAPFALLFCLPVHLIQRIEQWRQEVGQHIPDWLHVVAEIEAYSSLAGYAWEHPQEPFADVQSEPECGPFFDGTELGHPLIPATERVCNSLSLGDGCRLLMVSGSNMSGKSTMLRTVGVNVVLALMGAPVCAGSLRLSPIQLGTAMRVSDSLQDGKSLFYAVISRLKSIVDLTAQPLPVLFLLDEILQGTNSHDRRIGAEGVIRRLLEHQTIGIVTTHDLALTQITDQLPVSARNAHFEDRLADGQMVFDYRMREGVVERSNALELMRMMGLQV